MTHRIPLIGKRYTPSHGKEKRGLVIQSSDLPDTVPSPEVNEKHREIQQKIDRRKVEHGKQHGWIDVDDHGEVVAFNVDDNLNC